jgi:2'-5' RNA ligase
MSKNNWLSVNINDGKRQYLYDIENMLVEELGKEGIIFSVMEYNAIQMTALFMGDYLYKLNQANAFLKLITDQKQEYEFKFIGLELFPPKKHNLVVARFACSKDMTTRIRDMANIIDTVAETNIDKFHNFIPHITLGKINLSEVKDDTLETSSLEKNTYRKLSLAISRVQERIDLEKLNFSSSGLYLCGKVFAPNKQLEQEIRKNWFIIL